MNFEYNHNLKVMMKNTFQFKILTEVSIWLMIISCLIQVLTGCHCQVYCPNKLLNDNPEMVAKSIAATHLQRLQCVPGFKGLYISEMFPLYYYGENTPSAYEFKLESPCNNNNGYIVSNV